METQRLPTKPNPEFLTAIREARFAVCPDRRQELIHNIEHADYKAITAMADELEQGARKLRALARFF